MQWIYAGRPVAAVALASVAILCAAAVHLTAGRRRRITSERTSIAGTAAFIAAIVALALAIAAPERRTTTTDRQTGRIALLVDASESMREPVSKDDPTPRLRVAQAVRDEIIRSINESDAPPDMSEYRFGKVAFPVATGARLESPDENWTTASAQGDAMSLLSETVLTSDGIAPYAAVIISDGRLNRGRSLPGSVQRVAGAGIRVFSVTVGDTFAAGLNIGIRDVAAPWRCRLNDHAAITVYLTFSDPFDPLSLNNTEIEITTLPDRGEPPVRLPFRSDDTLDNAAVPDAVSISIQPPTVGLWKINIRLIRDGRPLNDADLSDNQRDIIVETPVEPLRVALVTGALRVGASDVASSLAGAGIELTVIDAWRYVPARRLLDPYPLDGQLDRYHAIIFTDVNVNQLMSALARRRLAERIKRDGIGVCLIGETTIRSSVNPDDGAALLDVGTTDFRFYKSQQTLQTADILPASARQSFGLDDAAFRDGAAVIGFDTDASLTPRIVAGSQTYFAKTRIGNGRVVLLGSAPSRLLFKSLQSFHDFAAFLIREVSGRDLKPENKLASLRPLTRSPIALEPVSFRIDSNPSLLAGDAGATQNAGGVRAVIRWRDAITFTPGSSTNDKNSDWIGEKQFMIMKSQETVECSLDSGGDYIFGLFLTDHGKEFIDSARVCVSGEKKEMDYTAPDMTTMRLAADIGGGDHAHIRSSAITNRLNALISKLSKTQRLTETVSIKQHPVFPYSVLISISIILTLFAWRLSSHR
ncbi:MAG: hypothetical protein ABIH86_01445 [Planctomycetota bacterium]